MTKKLISIFVAVMMILSIIPAAALASNAARLSSPATEKSSPATEKSSPATEKDATIWDFEEDHLENGWEFRDEDGDNNNWQWVNETYADAPIASSGEYSIRSRSYFGTALTPDNWAVSPAVELPEAESIVLSVMAASYMGYYPETFALYAFVDGAEEPVALGDDMQSPSASREFAEYTADLSEYAGQTVQVAIRHYNCEDQYMFYVDDVTITTDAAEPVDPTEPPADPTEPPADPTEPPAVDEHKIVGYYFETDPEEEGWEFMDQDGDGNNWEWMPNVSYYAYEGQGSIDSNSYLNGSALTPDNWAISPEIELLSANNSVTFYAFGRGGEDYGYEHFAVYAGTDIDNMTEVLAEQITELSYQQYTVDLTGYENETVRIAIRHFNCTNMYAINVDQFEVWGEEGDTPADPMVIDTIEINDFVEPAWGENPFFGVTVPEDANYTLASANWNWWSDEDFGELAETDIFDHEDYEYTMLFVVTPNENYEFAEDAVVTINGEQTLVDGSFIYIETDSATFYTIGFYVEEPAPAPTLDEALNVEGGELHFESEGAYPWFVVEEGERIYAQSGNAGVSSSDSILTTTITANAGDVVKFEYRAFGEGTNTYWDYCEFSIDGQRAGYWGAQQNDWELFTSEPMTAGEHTLTWKYHKDGSLNPNGDFFAVDNVEIAEGELPATDILGDVDMDGEVTTADALMALRYVMGLIELNEDQLAQADVTGDGEVTVADPLLILRHAMGLIETFPAEEE
jgi:hypothetical protein